jgi:tRNA 2-thiouridine synthesizing protein B
MSCLHTINKTPDSKLLPLCVSVLKPGDGILFIEDGIYHCAMTNLDTKIDTDIRVFTLQEDAAARGMLKRNLANIEFLNYRGFVELCCKYDKIVSWF